MLEVNNMTVQFSGLTAVNDLSFRVEKGEVFTLMGPNGAGKTTAFNAIGGFIKPTSGKIRFSGVDLIPLVPEKIASLGIRRTFQNHGIMREMSVMENVLTGLELSISSRFLGLITGSRPDWRAEKDAVQKAQQMLDKMGILDLQYRVAGDLSFGEQRLVEIARAMVADASLIMLDEPAVGLSPTEREHLGTVIRSLADEGRSVLLVEHVQDLVMAVSDQVLVLNYGKKLTQCPPAEVSKNKDVLEAYLGYEA